MKKQDVARKLLRANASETSKILRDEKGISAEDIGLALRTASTEKAGYLLGYSCAREISSNDLGIALFLADEDKTRRILRHRNAGYISPEHIASALFYADTETGVSVGTGTTTLLLDHPSASRIRAVDLVDTMTDLNQEKVALLMGHSNTSGAAAAAAAVASGVWPTTRVTAVHAADRAVGCSRALRSAV